MQQKSNLSDIKYLMEEMDKLGGGIHVKKNIIKRNLISNGKQIIQNENGIYLDGKIININEVYENYGEYLKNEIFGNDKILNQFCEGFNQTILHLSVNPETLQNQLGLFEIIAEALLDLKVDESMITCISCFSFQKQSNQQLNLLGNSESIIDVQFDTIETFIEILQKSNIQWNNQQAIIFKYRLLTSSKKQSTFQMIFADSYEFNQEFEKVINNASFLKVVNKNKLNENKAFKNTFILYLIQNFFGDSRSQVVLECGQQQQEQVLYDLNRTHKLENVSTICSKFSSASIDHFITFQEFIDKSNQIYQLKVDTKKPPFQKSNSHGKIKMDEENKIKKLPAEEILVKPNFNERRINSSDNLHRNNQSSRNSEVNLNSSGKLQIQYQNDTERINQKLVQEINELKQEIEQIQIQRQLEKNHYQQSLQSIQGKLQFLQQDCEISKLFEIYEKEIMIKDQTISKLRSQIQIAGECEVNQDFQKLQNLMKKINVDFFDNEKLLNRYKHKERIESLVKWEETQLMRKKQDEKNQINNEKVKSNQKQILISEQNEAIQELKDQNNQFQSQISDLLLKWQKSEHDLVQLRQVLRLEINDENINIKTDPYEDKFPYIMQNLDEFEQNKQKLKELVTQIIQKPSLKGVCQPKFDQILNFMKSQHHQVLQLYSDLRNQQKSTIEFLSRLPYELNDHFGKNNTFVKQTNQNIRSFIFQKIIYSNNIIDSIS